MIVKKSPHNSVLLCRCRHSPGLETLTPEILQPAWFLSRRAQREAGRFACFWSGVPDETAGHIHAAMRKGRGGEALALLQHHAHDYGYFLPSYADETSNSEIRVHG